MLKNTKRQKIKLILWILVFISIILLDLNLQTINYIENSYGNKRNDKSLEGLEPYTSGSTPLWIHTAGDSIEAVAISATGEYLVSGGRDNKVYLFNKSSSTPIWNYTLPSMVWSLAISADGNYIVAAAYWDGIFLFSKSSSIPIWNYTPLGGPPAWSYVTISEDGNYLVAGGGGVMYFFNRSSSIPMWNHTAGGGGNAVAISASGNFIAKAGGDISLFNKSSSVPLWSYSSGDFFTSVDISSDGNYIIGGSWNNNKIYLFNKSSSTPMRTYLMTGSAGIEHSVAISSDGQYMTSVSRSGWVYFFDKSVDIPVWNYSTGVDFRSVTISSDGRYIGASGPQFGNDKILLFERSSPIPLWVYNPGSDPRFISISLDATYLVAGTQNNNRTILFNIIPSPFNLSSDADTPDPNGSFNLSWTSADADNYSVYVHNSFISEINKSITLLASGITRLTHSLSGLLNGDYYYLVVAINDIANLSSNCIYVDVKIAPQIIFYPTLEYLNTTEPMEIDLYLEINCSVINSTVLEGVYLTENSTGIYVNRSMSLGINNEWTYKLDISALDRGDLLSFLFYTKDSFYVRKNDSNHLNFSLFIGDIYPPFVSIDYNLLSNPNYVSESTLLNISAFDVGERPSGIFQISYKIDSGTWEVFIDLFTLNNFSEGLHTIYYNALDVAGNSIVESITIYLVTANSDIDKDGLIYSDELIHSTDPFNNDTDSDKLSDGDEVNKYQTNPLSPDTDGDKLSDGEEVNKYYTNPLSQDTDGDGFSDYDEIFTFRTNPLSVFSSPSMNFALILSKISAMIVFFLIGLFKIKSTRRRRIEKFVIKQIMDPEKKILDCNKFKSKLRGFGSQLDIKEIIEDLQISGKYILDEQIFIKSVELDEIKNVIREKVNNIYKKNLSIREKSNLTIIKI
ncbi:hypothetical protein LCGC14_1752360 [marine sediment metagenome]|uniref:Uncharacterized protein n=1 Tax=marine sediment metagenome TaxID=412755 RepID=A0A0F9K2W4_9ZZZZ